MIKSSTTPHLHLVSRPRHPSGDVCRAHKLTVSKREIHQVEVKYCEDTRPGHQLKASIKQDEILCKCLKAKKCHISHHPSWYGRLYLYLKHFASSCRVRPWFTESPQDCHRITWSLCARCALEKNSCSQGLDLMQACTLGCRSSLCRLPWWKILLFWPKCLPSL